MAFGPDGKPCDGKLMCSDGQWVEIYKNWCYIHNKKMWHKRCGYTGDTIASFGHGQLEIDGMDLHAKRGPQDSIFLFARYRKYPHLPGSNGRKIKFGPPINMFMAGIGGCGYDDPLPRLLKAAGKKGLPKGANAQIGSLSTGDKKRYEIVDLWWEGKKGKIGKIIQNWIKLPSKAHFRSRWVGLTRSTIKEFFKWLEEQANEAGPNEQKWFAKIDKKHALRFNQGDAFFAMHTKDPIPATKTGKAKEPVISKMIKKMGEPKATAKRISAKECMTKAYKIREKIFKRKAERECASAQLRLASLKKGAPSEK